MQEGGGGGGRALSSSSSLSYHHNYRLTKLLSVAIARRRRRGRPCTATEQLVASLLAGPDDFQGQLYFPNHFDIFLQRYSLLLNSKTIGWKRQQNLRLQRLIRMLCDNSAFSQKLFLKKVTVLSISTYIHNRHLTSFS